MWARVQTSSPIWGRILIKKKRFLSPWERVIPLAYQGTLGSSLQLPHPRLPPGWSASWVQTGTFLNSKSGSPRTGQTAHVIQCVPSDTAHQLHTVCTIQYTNCLSIQFLLLIYTKNNIIRVFLVCILTVLSSYFWHFSCVNTLHTQNLHKFSK